MHCDDHFSISVFFFPLAVDSSALSMQCLCCESLRKKKPNNKNNQNYFYLLPLRNEVLYKAVL